jgi:ectoine hydroxylase
VTLQTDAYPSRQASKPRLIPRHDPVVYGARQDGAPLTAAQTEYYAENGFLHLEKVFAEDETDALLSALAEMRANTQELKPNEVILEPESHDLRSVFRVHGWHPLFKRLAADARLVEIARYLLNDDVYIHQSRVNFKPGFTGRDFYWHSDFETWHVEDGMPRMRALSMSISLGENTEFNGPLMIIPKSHQQFVACVGETPEDHYKMSLRKQEYGVPDHASLTQLVAAGGLFAAKGKPGAVTIFDCNAMHGSNSNISPFPRANVFLVYNSHTNRLQQPFGLRPPRPEFLAARDQADVVQPLSGALS